MKDTPNAASVGDGNRVVVLHDHNPQQFTCWFLVGNKEVYYIGTLFLYSLLRTNEFRTEGLLNPNVITT